MLKPLMTLGLGLSYFAVVGTAIAAIDKDTVADINGQKISKEEFDRRYKDNLTFFRYSPATKEAVLNDIINFEVAVQEAKKEGLDRDPTVRERMNTVLYQALVEKQLAGKFKSVVDVSEQEARDYCKSNPSIRLSQIVVPLNKAPLKTEQDEAMKKIRALQAKLSNTPFDKVAAGNPDQGASAMSGGDIGYSTKLQIDPVVYAEARRMSVGEVSKRPIRSQIGLHIIKVTGIQDCKNINVPEWQRMVFDERRAKIFQDYLSSLRSRAKVSINSDLIKE